MIGAAQTARMVLRAPVAQPARPVRVPSPSRRSATPVQVSQPAEPAEQEAARVARRVVAMPAPAVAAPTRRLGAALSAPGGQAARPAATRAAPPSALGVAAATGQPLPERVRAEMEPRFQADFSAVRVHADDGAARASRRLNAAAFTLGHQVFFGRDRFQPDSSGGRELLAHELTHTIQQGAAPQGGARPAAGAAPALAVASAPAAGALMRSVAEPAAEVRVNERSAPRVARLGVQDALDYFADKAAWIPGFTMFTFLLGFNPISLRAVDRSAANLLRALIQLLPGGPLITQALDNHGLIERVATWAEGQMAALGDIGASVRQAVDDFLDGLSWTDIFDLGGLWSRAKRIVTDPISRIIAFGRGLISGIIDFVKDAILRPIGALAQGTRGYPLLCAVLGFDPVTGDPSPQTPAALIGGFMTLIGQEEVWQNIQRANAIPRAWAWFQGALAGLMGFVRQIPTLFLNAFRSLQLVDIILVPRAFAKIVSVFAGIAGSFLSWALGTVIQLLEIIFSVLAPGAMGYLRRAGAALQSIFRNPIGFVGNLVRAAKAGFQRFAGGFLNHLKAGLLAWLTGSLPGIYIPSALSLPEILKFVLSVLGLSWANIRAKLVTAVGEPAVRAMEMGFDLVRTLVTQGPAAAWEQLKEQLANLKQMAIDALVDMVVNLVVTRAVPRLVAMFIPGAGFIGAILAIWGTIQTVVAQLSRIAQVVTGFLNSIAAIAAGNIGAAATRVEGILANLLVLAINFLAGFAGLGRVADRVRALIQRIRAPIDHALDRLVAWIVAGARRLGRFVAQAGVPNDPNERLRLGMRAAMAVIARRPPGNRLSVALVNGLVAVIKVRYGMRVLEAFQRGGRWWLRGIVNPPAEEMIPEDDADLLRQIYDIADREYRAAVTARPAQPGTPGGPPRGTHEQPRQLPAGGLAIAAASMPEGLPRGRIEVVQTVQGSGAPLVGVVQRPGFPGSDAVVSGATATERRVTVGRYSEVAATLSGIGNDRLAGEAAIAVLAGGDLPPRLNPLRGFFGGFRTLAAQEVRRDPIALATLSSVLTLVAGGAISIGAAFTRAQLAAEASAAALPHPVAPDPASAGRTTQGGLFPQSATPASAPARSVRESLGQTLPAGTPASRGTVAQTGSMLTTSVNAIVRAAQLVLRTNARPSNTDIVAAVHQVMRGIIGGV